MIVQKKFGAEEVWKVQLWARVSRRKVGMEITLFVQQRVKSSRNGSTIAAHCTFPWVGNCACDGRGQLVAVEERSVNIGERKSKHVAVTVARVFWLQVISPLAFRFSYCCWYFPLLFRIVHFPLTYIFLNIRVRPVDSRQLPSSSIFRKWEANIEYSRIPITTLAWFVSSRFLKFP